MGTFSKILSIGYFVIVCIKSYAVKRITDISGVVLPLRSLRTTVQ